MEFIEAWIQNASDAQLIDKIKEYRLRQTHGGRDAENATILIRKMENQLDRNQSN